MTRAVGDPAVSRPCDAARSSGRAGSHPDPPPRPNQITGLTLLHPATRPVSWGRATSPPGRRAVLRVTAMLGYSVTITESLVKCSSAMPMDLGVFLPFIALCDAGLQRRHSAHNPHISPHKSQKSKKNSSATPAQPGYSLPVLQASQVRRSCDHPRMSVLVWLWLLFAGKCEINDFDNTCWTGIGMVW